MLRFSNSIAVLTLLFSLWLSPAWAGDDKQSPSPQGGASETASAEEPCIFEPGKGIPDCHKAKLDKLDKEVPCGARPYGDRGFHCRVEEPCAICRPEVRPRIAVLDSLSYYKAFQDFRRIFDMNSHVYVLDGKEYTKDQLVKAFLDTAFQKHLWQDDVFMRRGYYANIPAPVFQYDKQVALPRWAEEWYREYIERKKGMPAFDSINRWNDKTRLHVTLCYTFPDCYPDPDKKLQDAKERFGHDDKYLQRTKESVQRLKKLIPQVKERIAWTSANTRRITGIDLVYADQETDAPEGAESGSYTVSGSTIFRTTGSRYPGLPMFIEGGLTNNLGLPTNTWKPICKAASASRLMRGRRSRGI